MSALPARTTCESGFTLIEVMISLLIFGLLAAAGVSLLSFAVRAQGATGAKLEQISAMNRLSSILTADLAQAAIRQTRGMGGEVLPVFTGESGANGSTLLSFVRAGWSNLDGTRRASEQKVEYAIIDGALVRIAYPMLDGATPLPPTAMLDHVRQVALRYRIDGAWSDRWTSTPQFPVPAAIELRVQRDTGVETRQLFLVGTGYGKRVDAQAR
ncbi:type II secretion system minor pseudopilin GspJ [Sphingomonas psychrolutea]|uniref:type II secretion system minor pseudopilin GspJ n=1 Tax=Sphingomonas psychrolutea TaxID=1259676 RepID=UPI001E44B465|nr:type II secretion system minor pseudopilin GspJ [Sphingomonas psychrolutea]